MKNILKRSLTGLLYVILLIGSVYYNSWATSIFFFIVLIFSSYEFSQLVKSSRGIFFWSIPAYVFYVLTIHYTLHNWFFVIWIVPVAHSLFILNKQKGTWKKISKHASSIVYISLPLGTVTQIQTEFGREILLSFFFILWAYDTGAYLIGNIMGKRLLSPRISPKKTIEGLIGGILMAFIVAYTFNQFTLSMNSGLIIGMVFIICFFATIGDLLESVLKRIAQKKDSGNLLPGHGGFLDRFDSVLLAAPTTLIYLKVLL